MYNKEGQKFHVINRFFVSGKEYWRIRFIASKNEYVYTAQQVKSGDVEDIYATNRPVDNNDISPKVTEPVGYESEDLKPDKLTGENDNDITPKIVEPVEDEDDDLEPQPPETFKIIAITPNSEYISVNSDELESFCNKNGLDLDAVNACIDGSQKTHKKWRFNKA